MKRSIAACTGMLIAMGSAYGAELAYTVRPTEMKAKPFTDAATLAQLAGNSKVDVLQRQSSWLQVKANANTGWVKMLSLRFDQMGGAPKAGAGNSNLGTLFNIVQTGSGGSTASTGVKGLKIEEGLRNPRPNPDALRQMEELDLTDTDVKAFAKAGKLSPSTMAYVAAPGAN